MYFTKIMTRRPQIDNLTNMTKLRDPLMKTINWKSSGRDWMLKEKAKERTTEANQMLNTFYLNLPRLL